MALFSKIKKGIGRITSVDGVADKRGESSFFSFPSDEELEDTRDLDGDIPNYSGGFEDIYSLENIDVKTIRRIGSSDSSYDKETDELPVVSEAPLVEERDPEIDELLDLIGDEDKSEDAPETICDSSLHASEFNFCVDDEGSLDSFCLYEPLEVLRLSQQAERALHESGKKTLRDLIAFVESGSSFIKGMGQGHIDEMKKALKEYIAGQELYAVDRYDMRSFLSVLVGDLDKIAVACFLERYGFTLMWTLTREEQASMRHLKAAQKDAAVASVIIEMTSEVKRRFVHERWRRIMRSFVLPWMERRRGIARAEELNERLARKSVQPRIMKQYSAFFETIYFDGRSLFSQCGCYDVAGELYFSSLLASQRYKNIISRAQTYFYTRDLTYQFPDFVALLSREFAREWEEYPDGFMEKALRMSPLFSVRKGADGVLVIRQM